MEVERIRDRVIQKPAQATFHPLKHQREDIHDERPFSHQPGAVSKSHANERSALFWQALFVVSTTFPLAPCDSVLRGREEKAEHPHEPFDARRARSLTADDSFRSDTPRQCAVSAITLIYAILLNSYHFR